MRTAVVEQERGAGLLLAEQRRQGLGVPWPRAGKSRGEGKKWSSNGESFLRWAPWATTAHPLELGVGPARGEQGRGEGELLLGHTMGELQLAKTEGAESTQGGGGAMGRRRAELLAAAVGRKSPCCRMP